MSPTSCGEEAPPCAPHNKNGTESKPKHWLEYGIFIFVVVTALCTGAAAWHTRNQWIVADETMRVANRAYVSSTDFQLVNYGGKVGNDVTWNLSAIIENTGNTGTKFLRLNEGLSAGPGPKWNFNTWFKSAPMEIRIAPHSQIIGSSFGFVGSSVNSVVRLGVIALGRASYYDIFNHLHFAEFCYAFVNPNRIDWQGYPPGNVIRVPGAAFGRCAGHNCEDDECGPEWRKRAEAMR